jgi:uncharacterized protein (TIGR03435 family)
MRKAALLGWFSAALAQPAFDVVSIRPSHDMMAEPHRIGCSGATFRATGELVNYMLQWAYDIQPFQFQGPRPSWFTDVHDTYDIEAKVSTAVTVAQCKQMVQSIFADRFKLKFHHETKELPVYALTVGKNGPKMRKLSDEGEPGSVIYNGTAVRNPDGELARGMTMEDLAKGISGVPSLNGEPVVDRTGLTGLYAFNLRFALFNDDAPDIREAVDEQLGLKLEPAKAPFEMFVIDHVERPSPN